MSYATMHLESERLQAIVVLNQRVKSGVVVRLLDTTEALHTDEINPVASRDRAGFVDCLPNEYRQEASALLDDLANQVTAHRATSDRDRADAPSDDPFGTVEPWHEAVTGAQILDELVAFINGYMVLPPNATEAVALWVKHTYVVAAADYTPYLLVTSPVRECGKTTLLELLLHLSYRAQMTGGITASALYRRIDKHSPTMLLDELDTRLRGDSGEMLRGVLNTGFQRSGKMTICVGDDHDARDFKTFSPKVLAGIGRVWDTVTSRSIPLRLARASKDEIGRLTKIRGDRIGATCLPLRRKLTRWAAETCETLRLADPTAPHELGARQSDVWRPLFAIADNAGERWAELARTSALALHGVAEDEGDYGLLLLQDLRTLFADSGSAALASASVVESLSAMEDRPWPEYRNDRPITTRGLASLVGRFGVKPKNIRIGTDIVKGYEYAELLPALNTYLIPTDVSATSATSAPITASPVVVVADVADRKLGTRATISERTAALAVI